VSVRVDVTGEAIAGHLLKKVAPTYPSTAKLQGVQGTVILNGVINKDGHFKKLQVLAGPPMLQQPAIDAVRQWAYTPYLLDGQPVEVETDVNVVFVLGR
jgi:protein TonB